MKRRSFVGIKLRASNNYLFESIKLLLLKLRTWGSVPLKLLVIPKQLSLTRLGWEVVVEANR